MNCKPGDWAEYVGMHTDYRGYYVQVIKPAPSNASDRSSIKGAWWEISPSLGNDSKGRPRIYVADRALRPLPPDLLKDELSTEKAKGETT